MSPARLRAAATAALLALATLACEQQGLPADPNAKPPSEDKIKQAIDTRSRMGAEAEALPNAMSGTITGIISLADGVEAPQGTLFVYARKVGVTSGPPLAVARFDGSSFPVRFELSKANVMMPGAPFEGPVTLSARMDADGNPMTRGPGDVEGQASGAIQIGAANVPIVLGGESPAAAGAAPMGAGGSAGGAMPNDATHAGAASRTTAPADAVHTGAGVAGKQGDASQAAAVPGGSIKGRIELAPGATAKGGVIFLMARQEGVTAGPPLAVRRLDPQGFPMDFELSTAHVMIPGASLSGRLTLTARLDADGDAMTKGPDDLNGASQGAVQLGDTSVVITLAGN